MFFVAGVFFVRSSSMQTQNHSYFVKLLLVCSSLGSSFFASKSSAKREKKEKKKQMDRRQTKVEGTRKRWRRRHCKTACPATAMVGKYAHTYGDGNQRARDSAAPETRTTKKSEVHIRADSNKKRPHPPNTPKPHPEKNRGYEFRRRCPEYRPAHTSTPDAYHDRKQQRRLAINSSQRSLR